MDDELDPQLEQRFEALEAVVPPDVWASVSDEQDTTVVVASRARTMLAVAAVIVAVGAVGGLWLSRPTSTEADQVTASADADKVTASADAGQIAASADADANPTSTAPSSAPDPLECSTTDLADSLGKDLPTFDYQPSFSLADLVQQSNRAVRGQLIDAVAGAGGTIITVKAAADGGERVTSLWTPATSIPTGELNGSFVAFLIDEAVDTADQARGLAWLTHVEGFWVSCDDTSEAASVLIHPDELGWRETLDDGVSLDELWLAVQFPDGQASQPVGPPSVIENGAAIYDLSLVGGERFRLSLPEQLTDDMQLIERPEPAPIIVEGTKATIAISFDFCFEEDTMSLNGLGSAVVVEDLVVQFCRANELISVRVTLTEPLIDAAGAAELFDLRPINVGSRYGAALESFMPFIGACANCSPWGPVLYPDDNVVVNWTGSTEVTAVDLTTLAKRWTIDTGGADTYLHPGPDGVYLDATAGPFLRLDPATGAEVWRVDRDPGERDSGLSIHTGDTWLLRSSFAVAGANQAPVLRRIDPGTGEPIWTAVGRSGAEWQWTRPQLFDGVVVMMDVPDDVEIASASLLGFDVLSGAEVWSTDLESPSPRFDSGTVAIFEFEDGRALLARTVDGDIVRVDPATGNILWRTAVARGRFGGTEFGPEGALAIDITTPGGQVLLDQKTGERIDPAAGLTPRPDCTALYGDEPWLVLFEQAQTQSCVVVADFQNVQVWNKGFESMTVGWPGGDRIVPSDDFFATGQIGDVLGLGPNEIESTPFPMPTIWVLPESLSLSTGFGTGDDPFAILDLGISLEEASAVLLAEVAVDPNLRPGPSCWAAVIAGDPYSPTFIVEGNGDQSSVITEIVRHGPNRTHAPGYNGCE